MEHFYDIEDVIGYGMDVVLLGIAKGTSMKVAIKRVSKLRSFEVEVLRNSRHENLVSMCVLNHHPLPTDVGSRERTLFVLMREGHVCAPSTILIFPDSVSYRQIWYPFKSCGGFCRYSDGKHARRRLIQLFVDPRTRVGEGKHPLEVNLDKMLLTH